MSRWKIMPGTGRSRRPVPPASPFVRLLLLAVVAVLCWSVEAPAAPTNDVPRVYFINDWSAVPYHYTVEWFGYDRDGSIDHFEYSLDGEDWVSTPDTSAAFVFSAPNPDSTNEQYYVGSHQLQLRAMDNEGAYSNVDTWDFVARNEVPVTTIVKPDIASDLLVLGSSVRSAWDGVDPDGPPGASEPAGYYYKLLRLDTLTPPISILRAVDPDILYQHGGDWTYLSGDSLERVLPLGVPGQYVFGVRAVDVDGAAERRLEFGRNAFKFLTRTDGGVPELTLDGGYIGKWSGAGVDSFAVAVPTGRPLRFSAACSAEAQGEACVDIRWGLDLAGPEAVDGWSDLPWPWTLPPLTFTEPGTHRLFVQARDSYVGVSTIILRLDLLDFPFDRAVLWVDDCRDATYPNDAQHDAFWASLFRDSGRFDGDWDTGTQVDKFDALGGNDTDATTPTLPALAELAHYRLVIWETNGAGYSGLSALLMAASQSSLLGAYLTAGGSLWVDGVLTVPPMLPPPAPNVADFTYPKDLTLYQQSFALRFMKLFSTQVKNAKGATPNDNLVGVVVPPGEPEIYPAMQQDPNKVNPFKLSVSHCDAIFDPILAQNIGGFRGVLDSLYAYQPKVSSSTYRNRPVALRWHETAEEPLHGRVQWFGFPLYYMQKAQAQEAFNRSVDWLLQSAPPIPVHLTAFAAQRTESGVTVTWSVADAVDHGGFRVYREMAGSDREELTESLLTGRAHYEFVDAAPPEGAADYWLAELSRTGAITWHGPASVGERPLPRMTVLEAPLPNPFSASVRISYRLPAAEHVRLGVFDILGRRVADLIDQVQAPGTHTTSWSGMAGDGRPASAGFYILRLETADAVRVRKVVLMR